MKSSSTTMALVRSTCMLIFVVVFFCSTSISSDAQQRSDDSKIKEACDSREDQIGSTPCVIACRALQKAHGNRNAFKHLSARQREICEMNLREAGSKKMEESPKTKDNILCAGAVCNLKFVVIDPYTYEDDEMRFNGPTGYSLIKTYKCTENRRSCSHKWELQTPDGGIEVFEKCSQCKEAKHVRGSLTKATLVNAGGLEGEDVLIRVPK